MVISDRQSTERGQALILMVLAMNAIFMLGVIIVDVGLWVSERRVAQTAADNAALAGRVELTSLSGAPGVVAKAQEWATKNGYTQGVDGATVTVNYPYSDSTKIEVEVSKPAPLLFASILGLAFDNDIGARAVGTALTTTQSYAVFANRTDPRCPHNTLQWSGGNATVLGAVHSNGDIKMSGQDNTITGATTYVCPSDINSNNTFNPPPIPGGHIDWPLTFTTGDFPCTYGSLTGPDIDLTDGTHWLNAATKTLNPGVYCAPTFHTLSLAGTNGNVTLVSNSSHDINVSAANLNLTAFAHNVLAFAASQGGGIQFSGAGSFWQGLLVAQFGNVQISGSTNAAGTPQFVGALLGNTVQVSGQYLKLTGAYLPLSSDISVGLIE